MGCVCNYWLGILYSYKNVSPKFQKSKKKKKNLKVHSTIGSSVTQRLLDVRHNTLLVSNLLVSV